MASIADPQKASPAKGEKSPGTASDKISLENGKVVSEQAADETLRLIEEHGANVGPLTPEAEGKLKKKLYLHILLLVIIIDLMLYVRTCSV